MSSYPRSIEEIRSQEFPQLRGRTYLDHAGSQLPPNSLLDTFCEEFKSTVYGNPHSESTPSKLAGYRVDEIRLRTLAFFGASSDEYDLIFVANATAAVKLVCDGIRDFRRLNSYNNRPTLLKKLVRKPDFYVYYHKDAHTSLVGVREHSSRQRCFINDEEVEIWIKSLATTANDGTPTLFAYPGQSNMTGRRLPLSWSSRIRCSPNTVNVYTLLDAAALATTKRLDISAWQPDFVALSFYKIFGFPDLGALIVRKDTGGPILDARRYFGGGTVDMVIAVDAVWHIKRQRKPLHERHEDGTLPFHNIIALDHALDSITRVYGSMDAISAHTSQLTRAMHEALVSLTHASGSPLIRVYNDESAIYGDPETQGATIAFSVLADDGTIMKFKQVERTADLQNIYLRAGSLCNPGGMATYLGWTARELRHAHTLGHSCSSPIEIHGGRTTGVVRASLGACSDMNDVNTLIDFLRSTYVGVLTADPGNTLAKPKERKLWMRVRAVPVISRSRRRQPKAEEPVFFVTNDDEEEDLRLRRRDSSPSPTRSDNFFCTLDEPPSSGACEPGEEADRAQKPIGALFSRSKKWAKSLVDLRRAVATTDSRGRKETRSGFA